MSQVISFVSWVLSQIPAFLMAEPVCYFVGFYFLAVIIGILSRIFNLGRF